MDGGRWREFLTGSNKKRVQKMRFDFDDFTLAFLRLACPRDFSLSVSPTQPIVFICRPHTKALDKFRTFLEINRDNDQIPIAQRHTKLPRCRPTD
jgi:hypothetical protein